jgi:hypothetical protein
MQYARLPQKALCQGLMQTALYDEMARGQQAESGKSGICPPSFCPRAKRNAYVSLSQWLTPNPRGGIKPSPCQGILSSTPCGRQDSFFFAGILLVFVQYLKVMVGSLTIPVSTGLALFPAWKDISFIRALQAMHILMQTLAMWQFRLPATSCPSVVPCSKPKGVRMNELSA